MRESKSTIRTTLAGFAVLGSVFGVAAHAGCLDAKAVAAPFASHLADRSGGFPLCGVSPGRRWPGIRADLDDVRGESGDRGHLGVRVARQG